MSRWYMEELDIFRILTSRLQIKNVHEMPNVTPIIIESCDPEGPFGAKEGEGPLLPILPAVVNAVRCNWNQNQRPS